MLTSKEVLAQSKGAFEQWESTWKKNAIENGELFKKIGKSHKELQFKGAGKKCLCIGMGPSFEDQIETIKKYADNPAIDIFCVDKAMGFLMQHGVKPKYVNIADAGIDYDRWCKPYIDQVKDVILLSNVTANPEWAREFHKNGAEVYFYVNKDNIKTEEIYTKISGCMDIIPAGSNVGNSVVIFGTSILGHDEFILIGYDFCWGYEDNYYAFADETQIGTNKRGWMRHMIMQDKAGRLIQTSQNLLFSSKWLSDFYNAELKQFSIKVTDCSNKGILYGIPDGKLENLLKNTKQRKLNDAQKHIIFNNIMKQEIITADQGQEKLNETLKRHKVVDVGIRYITEEQDKWLLNL